MGSITKLSFGESDPNPSKRLYRSRSLTGKQDPMVLDRQARITLAAFRAHELREDALAFLNDHHPALEGRPVEVSGQTEEGLRAALALLAAAPGKASDRG